MDNQRNPFAVLGLEPGATNKEIQSAMKRQSKALHPDLHAGDKEKEEKFKQVTLAYEEISNLPGFQRHGADEVKIHLPGSYQPSGDRTFYTGEDGAELDEVKASFHKMNDYFAQKKAEAASKFEAEGGFARMEEIMFGGENKVVDPSKNYKAPADYNNDEVIAEAKRKLEQNKKDNEAYDEARKAQELKIEQLKENQKDRDLKRQQEKGESSNSELTSQKQKPKRTPEDRAHRAARKEALVLRAAEQGKEQKAIDLEIAGNVVNDTVNNLINRLNRIIDIRYFYELNENKPELTTLITTADISDNGMLTDALAEELKEPVTAKSLATILEASKSPEGKVAIEQQLGNNTAVALELAGEAARPVESQNAVEYLNKNTALNKAVKEHSEKGFQQYKLDYDQIQTRQKTERLEKITSLSFKLNTETVNKAVALDLKLLQARFEKQKAVEERSAANVAGDLHKCFQEVYINKGQFAHKQQVQQHAHNADKFVDSYASQANLLKTQLQKAFGNDGKAQNAMNRITTAIATSNSGEADKLIDRELRVGILRGVQGKGDDFAAAKETAKQMRESMAVYRQNPDGRLKETGSFSEFMQRPADKLPEKAKNAINAQVNKEVGDDSFGRSFSKLQAQVQKSTEDYDVKTVKNALKLLPDSERAAIQELTNNPPSKEAAIHMMSDDHLEWNQPVTSAQLKSKSNDSHKVVLDSIAQERKVADQISNLEWSRNDFNESLVKLREQIETSNAALSQQEFDETFEAFSKRSEAIIEKATVGYRSTDAERLNSTMDARDYYKVRNHLVEQRA